MRIYMDDITKAGHCARGTRRWFVDHGMDFPAFLAEGIAASELLERGDALAEMVVERKIKREESRG